MLCNLFCSFQVAFLRMKCWVSKQIENITFQLKLQLKRTKEWLKVPKPTTFDIFILDFPVQKLNILFNFPYFISRPSQRHICLACGRLAKQVGSSSFYDINNTTTFATSDGYVSIAKKLRDLFHLELPRSKIIAGDQICRKCYRALNEIHFLETQVSSWRVG